MAEASKNREARAFSWWLRTGRLPQALGPDGLELKFNPWHDPANGRFTSAGAGRQEAAGAGDAIPKAGGRTLGRTGHVALGPGRESGKSQRIALPKVGLSRQGSATGEAKKPERLGLSSAKTKPVGSARSAKHPNPVAEFVGGVGEGLYDVGRGAVADIQGVLTTNPVVTVRDAASGIANRIDAAIAAEDIPARIQVSRAAAAVSHASARDIGRASATVAGNVALAAAPGAGLSKVAAVRRLRVMRPRPTFDPPQIGWVKETIKSDKPWKSYNDSAAGARSGHAPTLTRTMPDGSRRPVKFDGVQGDYVIDRKWSVRNMANARAQVLRQSEVLAQNRLIGLWEVPTPVQKVKALKLLRRMNVGNIHVKVVKP